MFIGFLTMMVLYCRGRKATNAETNRGNKQFQKKKLFENTETNILKAFEELDNYIKN